MTSVTLPSTSGPIHGGYSSVAEETTSSEPEFETPRPSKRCLSVPSVYTCKKRRKQSTPIRIYANEAESAGFPGSAEGKVAAPSPEPDYGCPVCQVYFNNSDQLQNHIATEHCQLQLKKEPEEFAPAPTQVQISQNDRSETPLELTMPKPEVQWKTDIQPKDWMGSTLPNLPFNPANPMFMAFPQFAQPDNLPRQPIRIFNPDAYCDLCNKEFCNKYFLKTHKANKHGIYSDSPSMEQPSNSVNIPSYAATIKLPTSVPSVDLSTMKPSTHVVNPFSDVFPNPYFSRITKTTPKPTTSEEEPDNTNQNQNGFPEAEKLFQEDQTEETSSPSVVQESTSFKAEGEPFFEPPAKLSPGQLREPEPTQLRRIGVMNPKAFCEICCKEYCNKYFLRTHKMKRHGIYIPDDKAEKEIKIEGAGQFGWQQKIQTSPLNLIMTEQSQADRKTTSPNDFSCDLCGIKFQNASLAQLHNVSLHGKLYSKEQDQSDSSAEEFKKANEQQGSNEKGLNAEAISEDLQKLQTMILQLNELDVGKTAPVNCTVCSKEFENRYYLHAHMMTEHGILLEDNNDIEKSAEAENNSNNNTVCDLCGKDVQNVQEMKKHILEFHTSGNQTNNNIKEELGGFSTPEKVAARVNVSGGQMAERRVSMNVTPTSSYCDICNKELCNKYFMKTHMQRMHGIEIENGAQIGGVICDICNKELCSKYFLRVHKHNTHGIVEYGTSLLQPRKSEVGDNQAALAPEPDPALKPADLADLSHRYFTHFTEVCTICSRRFRSTKWLKAHLLSDHGQAGAEKWSELEQQLQQTIGSASKPSSVSVKSERTSPTLKIPNGNGQENQPKVGIQNVLSSLFGIDESSAKTYQCSYCPFTTSLLPFLFVHEKSHAISMNGGELPFKCPVCHQNFMQPEHLQHHMLTQHPFLPLPPLPQETKEEEITENPDQSREQKEEQEKQQEGAELPNEISQALKEMAKKSQLPASYALPKEQQSHGEDGPKPGYVMQAFVLEESSSDRRVVPAIVFLPVLQKQPNPVTVTFTLTPA